MLFKLPALKEYKYSSSSNSGRRTNQYISIPFWRTNTHALDHTHPFILLRLQFCCYMIPSILFVCVCYLLFLVWLVNRLRGRFISSLISDHASVVVYTHTHTFFLFTKFCISVLETQFLCTLIERLAFLILVYVSVLISF